MNFPKIDLASLPAMDELSGIYGSVSSLGGTYDDKIVSIMVYVYETVPPQNLI